MEMDEARADAGLDPSAGELGSNRQRTSRSKAAKKYPDRFAIMGQFPPENPDNVRLIPGWRSQTGMKGLRWALFYHDQPRLLAEGKLDWIWAAAEKEGLPVSLQAGVFLKKFRSIAETHPRLKLIIDHCGLNPFKKDAAAFEHFDELLALAKLPNVAVKATGAPAYSTQAYPFRNIHDGLHRIFDAFRAPSACSGAPTLPACAAATASA